MEPYSYVGNNPINFTDPTGMSKEESDGWRIKNETGEVKYSPEYTSENTPSDYTYFDGGNIDNTIYNTDGTHEPLSGGKTDCVSCHHTTTVGNGTANNSPYERYTIWGNNRTGGDDQKTMRFENVNAINYNVADVPLMTAGGGSLNCLNVVSQSGKIIQQWAGAASGFAALTTPTSKSYEYMQRININFLPPSPYNNAAIHIGKPKDTLVDMRDINSAKKSNLRDSLRVVSKYNQSLKSK